MRRQVTFVVGIVAMAIAGIIYTLAVGNEPLLGLDLQGGASVVRSDRRQSALGAGVTAGALRRWGPVHA